MDKIRATLDTNIAPLEDLQTRADGANVELAFVTVTARELAAHSYGEDTTAVRRVLETAVLDESQFNNSVLAGDEEVDCFAAILQIVSNGSFPKPDERGSLSSRQRNQLRDAIIFAAHVRDRRDIFVTLDAKGFICGNRKHKLESTFDTRIMTRTEFFNYLESRAAI